MPKTRPSKVTAALGCGLALAGVVSSAHAQVDTNAPTKVKKIVVTGSNIPTAETVGSSPVETITSEAIDKSGAADVLDVLKKLSTSFAGQGNIGQTLNNGGYGEATVAVRNLPTLVLLNGKRLVGTPFSALSSGSSLVDVNTIPIGAVERIEVLKDGASSIYGSDAIGGVVNIITKKFNGVEISGRYGFATESGSKSVTEQKATIVAGASTATSSFVGAATWYHMDPLLTKDRKLGSQGILDLAGQGVNPPSYISPSYPGRVDSFILAGSPLAIGAPGYSAGMTTPPRDGAAYPSIAAYNAAHPGVYLPLSSTPLGAQLDAAGVGNYPLLNTTQYGTASIQQQDRRQFYGSFEHDLLGENMRAFADFMYSQNRSQGQLAPSPAPSLFISNISVPANNPYNPFGIDLGPGGAGSPRIRSRFVDFGNRIFDSQSDTYHFVAGLKGLIAQDYEYQAAYTYNRSSETQYTRNAVNGAALNLALKPDPADPTGLTSQLTDPVTGAAIPTYNIFGVGVNNPATINAIRTTLYNNGVAEEWGIDAVVNGKPFSLPAGPVGFAVGAEYRFESLSLDSDGLTAQNLVPGLSFAGRFPGGQRDQYAAFAEVEIPVMSPSWNVPGFYKFEITASGRYEHLNPGGDSVVPKVGVKWNPIDDQVAFRGTYSEGFIAPTLYSLFGPTRISNPTISVGGSSGQIQTSLPTNPSLPPSTSRNYTLGVVISPKAVPGLTFSAEYYRIIQDNIAYNPDANSRVQSLNALGSASPFAGDFRFSDNTRLTTGAANQVTLANFGSLVIPSLPGAAQRTDGLDFSLAYSLPTDNLGRWLFYGNANVLLSYYFQGGPTAPAYQYRGYYTDPQVVSGFQGTLPDYLINVGFNWDFKGFSTAVNARYIPSVTDLGDMFPAAGSPANSFTSNGGAWKVEDYYTIDMQLAYTFGKNHPTKRWLTGTRIAVGCNNITDNIAPLISSSSEDGTDKATYDILGRFVYFEISKKF